MNFQRDLSLFFLRLRGIYKRLPLKTKREEKRERKRKLSLFCVCACVYIIIAQREEFVFLCVVCFFSRACVFFEDTCAKTKKKSKKLAGEKNTLSNVKNDIIDQFSKDQIQRAVDKEIL